jgi:hypothetical protein
MEISRLSRLAVYSAEHKLHQINSGKRATCHPNRADGEGPCNDGAAAQVTPGNRKKPSKDVSLALGNSSPRFQRARCPLAPQAKRLLLRARRARSLQ